MAAVAAHDLLQRRHSLLRNFPVIGHGRYLVEAIGPELRQYIVAGNDEERPFSRDQRRWVYASAKLENNYFGFGTDNDIEHTPGYPVVKHATLGRISPPSHPTAGQEAWVPCAKMLGGWRARRAAFRPDSVVNISGMSFGSLSGKAIEALNRGAKLADCLQNTGEGGLSVHHRHGGELVFQIGTAYFGCRDERGRFELARLKDLVASAPVRALEIKLSQGAKPGLGGMLPGCKVTAEIAEIRDVPEGKDCVSPSRHREFSDVDGLIEFVERIAEATGLPVGVKSAVGDMGFWEELAARMVATGGGPDFINIDGGEGGTGAAPLAFSDHVALPFKVGFARIYSVFARAGLNEDVVFIGAGRLGFPEQALFAFALGCDMVNVGREAMMAIGCIQAQRCHTGSCPTGVATQSKWLMRGLDPEIKGARTANYVRALRAELLAMARTVGVSHPGLVRPEDLEIVTDRYRSATVREIFGYEADWRRPSPDREEELRSLIGSGGGVQMPGPEGGPIAGDGTGCENGYEITSAEPEEAMAKGGD